MEEEAKKLKELIESSERILATSHISPDPDAVSSLLLMGATLKANYPDKQISMVLEEEPLNLDFLEGYSDIRFGSLVMAIEEFKPQLLILLDGNNYERVSRLDGEKVRQLVAQHGLKTAAIDHHEQDDKDETDVFINRGSPATAQTVYEVLFDDLALRRPENAAQIAMLGFYADTGGFTYLKPGPQGKLFNFAEQLVTEGANVEQTKNQLSKL